MIGLHGSGLLWNPAGWLGEGVPRARRAGRDLPGVLRVMSGRGLCRWSAGCWARQRGKSGEGDGEVVGPGPVFGDAEVEAALASGNAGGGMQQPVAKLLRLGLRELAIQRQGLGPGKQVDRCEGEFQPRGVDVELAGREAAEAGVLACPDAVLDAGVGPVTGVQPGQRARSSRGVGGDELVPEALDGVEQVQLSARGADARDGR